MVGVDRVIIVSRAFMNIGAGIRLTGQINHLWLIVASRLVGDNRADGETDDTGTKSISATVMMMAFVAELVLADTTFELVTAMMAAAPTVAATCLGARQWQRGKSRPERLSRLG